MLVNCSDGGDGKRRTLAQPAKSAKSINAMTARVARLPIMIKGRIIAAGPGKAALNNRPIKCSVRKFARA